METVVVPVSQSVRRQLEDLPPRLRTIAEDYIRRLRLEPDLGVPITHGTVRDHTLADAAARRVYFDADSKPQQLFGEHRGRRRAATDDLSDGPAWRIVYRVRQHPTRDLRFVETLGVGRGHPDPKAGITTTAYDHARAALRAQQKGDR